MRNGFNTNVTEPQNKRISAISPTSWLQRHAEAGISPFSDTLIILQPVFQEIVPQPE